MGTRRTALQASDDSQQVLALSIAVQHPAFSSEPRVLCAAAQACKGLQQAVRQRNICSTAVVLNPEAPHQQLHSFASWLADHAHLVSSITANRTELDRALNIRVPSDVEVMCQHWAHTLFAQRLLLKALQPAVTPAAAAGSPAGDPEQAAPQQQQQLLRLTRFSSNYANPPVLKALPAHSLTRLQLDVSGLLEAERPEVPQLLAGLSNLQELQLDSADSSELPGSCFAAIAQLAKLTQLHIEASSWVDVQHPLQQLLAQPPPLRVLHLQLPDHEEPLDMSALTQLEELVTETLLPASVLPRQLRSLRLTGVDSELVDLSALTQLEEFVTYQLHPATVLPSQLRSLQLTELHMPAQEYLRPVSALQQLQRLSLEIGYDDGATETVLRLAKQLPALQQVALEYTEACDAAAAAHSSKQLPQLQELRYTHEASGHFRVHRCEINDILAGVAAATSLTKLELEAVCIAECHEDESDDEAPCEWAAVAACRRLSGLTGLRDLCILEDSILPPCDALALTALTSLTRLLLSNMRGGVGDVAAAVLVHQLTQLRHLDLRWCELGKGGWDLAGIEHLMQLAELRLEGNPKLSSVALSRVMRLPESVHVTLDAKQCALVDELGSPDSD